MGFGLSDLDPTKHVKKFVNSTEGKYLINPLYGQADEANKRMNPKAPDVQQAKEDPRLSALRKRLTDDAKKFRASLPQYQEEQLKPLAAEAESQAREGVKQTRQNYSRRGLLYSGYRAQDEANIAANRAKTIAEQKAEINRESNNIANEKEMAAAGVGLESYGDSIDRANASYTAQQDAIKRRQAQLAQLGEGLGYGIGYMGAKGATT